MRYAPWRLAPLNLPFRMSAEVKFALRRSCSKQTLVVDTGLTHRNILSALVTAKAKNVLCEWVGC